VVATQDGQVSVDVKGKANGRGAYLILSKEVIEKARKSKALDKKLRSNCTRGYLRYLVIVGRSQCLIDWV